MKGNYNGRLEAYFPTALIYFGYLLVLVGFPTIAINYFLGPILVIVGLFLITAHYGITVDLSQRRYREYWSALGFKKGTWKDMPGISHIFINRKNYSQVLGSRGSSSKFHFTIYRGFLKTHDEENIEISQSKNRDKVQTAANDLAARLRVKVLDGTMTQKN